MPIDAVFEQCHMVVGTLKLQCDKCGTKDTVRVESYGNATPEKEIVESLGNDWRVLNFGTNKEDEEVYCDRCSGIIFE